MSIFCHQCGFKLPDSANFCSKCGTATNSDPSNRGRDFIPTKFPTRSVGIAKEPQYSDYIDTDHDELPSMVEFTTISRKLITVDNQAAALIIYCHPNQQGKNTAIEIDESNNLHIKSQKIYANIVARQVGGRTIYAAIFPRIYFLTDEGIKAGITQTECFIRGFCYFIGDTMLQKFGYATLNIGLITEIDWSSSSLR